MKRMFMPIITLLTLFITSYAQAVSCGDVITSNTTLTADLHCTTGYYALELRADDITLDLNGFRLSGTTDLAGVIVFGHNNVRIIGNGGVISGFWAGINTARSDALQVQSTSFYDLGVGVVISSGNGANINNNDFIQTTAQGVFITNFVAGQTADSNTINNNEFFRTRVGIEVCGDNSNGNRIKNNLIWLSEDYGIRIIRSDKNVLYNNRILNTTNTAIRIDDSSLNKITSNSLQMGRVGLGVYADSSGGCFDSGPITSRKNKFNGNHAFEFETAIVMGIGTTSGEVRRNNLTGNKLYDNTTGIFFNNDAHNNDATSNAYTGTTSPISDSGVGNSY